MLYAMSDETIRDVAAIIASAVAFLGFLGFIAFMTHLITHLGD